MDTLADAGAPEAIAAAAERARLPERRLHLQRPGDLPRVRDRRRRRLPRARASGRWPSPPATSAPSRAREFYAHMDAANVDLKAFTEDFYQQALRRPPRSRCSTRSSTSSTRPTVWFEITTLADPRRERLRRRARRDDATGSSSELGPDVPLHFTAFHPDFKMLDRPAHAAGDARAARARSRIGNGVRYVYTGNVHDPRRAAPRCCPACGATRSIGRDWYRLTSWALSPRTAAAALRAAVPGRFEAGPALGRPPPARPDRRPIGGVARLTRGSNLLQAGLPARDRCLHWPELRRKSSG